MELIAAVSLGAACLLLVLFPTIVFFTYCFFILMPLAVFFWFYINYFYGILPTGPVANLILLSVLLILFPFLLFQMIAVAFGLLIMKSLKNQENNAFLFTKNAVGTLGKRIITYRNLFLFFFLTYRKKTLYYLARQWPLFVSILALFMTISFLNTLKIINVTSPLEVARVYK